MRVLEEGDEDERVVHSEVGHTINGHHFREAARRRPVDETSGSSRLPPTDDDPVALVRGENDG